MNEADSIAVTTRLSERDLFRGNLTVLRFQCTPMWIARQCLFSVAVFGVIFAIFLHYGSLWRTLAIGIVSGLVFPLLFFPVFLPVFLGVTYFRIRSSCRTNPNLLGPFSYLFSMAGLRYEGPTAKGETAWSTYPWIRETTDYFLFYPLKTFAYILPKRSFQSQEDVNTLRAILSQNHEGERSLLNH